MQILKHTYGFVIADSRIDKNNELVDVDDEISVVDFINNEEIDKFARLIYCKAE